MGGSRVSDNDALQSLILTERRSRKATDFFEIENGHADFVNGTRLIYKMEKGAMQSLNKLGIDFFNLLYLNLYQ